MKRLIIQAAIALLAFGFGSCKKDFLVVGNTQQLYRQTYVKNLSTMQEFMNGIYLMLSYQFHEGRAEAYPELAADNLKPVSVSDNMINHYTWTQSSNGTDVGDFVGSITGATSMDPLWKVGYRIIRACNFVIEDISKYEAENPGKAAILKGEALAIRAYLHFRLVNIFSQCYTFTADASHPGIPYITTSDVTQPYNRQTTAVVYQQMIADLNEAIQLLPVTVSDTRIMNRVAAKAIMARIYLFKEDFTNAKILAKEVTDQVPLMTIAAGYPGDLFKLKSSPSQTECLLQLNPVNSPKANYINLYLRRAPIQFVATNDVAAILTEHSNDARKAWVNGSPSQWSVTKFPTGIVTGVTPVEVSYYPAIIRSSEMFLTVAEAAAKTNDEVAARIYLNAIRKRANPAIADITATGAALIDSIYKERRKELAFESLRLYDLQRWKLGVHRADVLGSSPKDLPFPSEKAIAPIPFIDIKLAGLTPNPGY